MDEAALDRWLQDAPAQSDGAVLSWVGDGGYPYVEAAALLVRWWSPERGADAMAQRLAADVASGVATRNGIAYAFDTAVALAALAPRTEHRLTCARLAATIEDAIEARRASWPPHADRWSTRWSPHLLKMLVGLGVWEVESGARSRGAEILVDELAPRVETARYVHAYCYAIEGCLVVGLDDIAGCGARRLAAAQRENGALPAFFDDRSCPARSDATAQAIRIWCAIDPARYATEISHAVGALTAMQHPTGGLRYEPGSSHVNTWASVFASQALAWRRDGAEVSRLL